MNIFYYGHFLNGSIIGNTMMTDTSRHKHLECEMALQLAGLLLAVGGGGRGDGGRGQDWLTDQRTMCRALTVACTEAQSAGLTLSTRGDSGPRLQQKRKKTKTNARRT